MHLRSAQGPDEHVIFCQCGMLYVLAGHITQFVSLLGAGVWGWAWAAW